MKKLYLLTLLCSVGFFVSAQQVEKKDSVAQEKPKENKLLIPELKDIEIIQMLQLWDVNTMQAAGNTGQDNRNDIYIRRGRLGVKGKLRKDLSYYVVFAYDGIGRDKNTAGNGLPNDADNHDFYLWDAFWTWSYKPMFNVTGGYFRPQVGRENISSAFNVITFEKSLPNFQLRTHIMGRNIGREMGLNVGGYHRGIGWSFNYNLGYFDNSNDKVMGTGTRWNPMLAGRAVFSIGDPEMDKYKLSYVQSYYGNRKGVSIGFNGTYQATTEIFSNNSMCGADVLANWGPIDLILEYDLLMRNSFIEKGTSKKYTSDYIYSLKGGYNYVLKNGKIVQAVFAYSAQNGQNYGTTTPSTNTLTGAFDQDIYDAGINYLLNRDKLKVNLHYVWGKRKDKAKDQDFSYAALGFQYTF